MTAKALKLALDFGFNNESVYEGPSKIVRLRDHTNKTNLIPYQDNKYTKHIDYIMRNYFWYLNDQEIILWTSKEKVDVSLLEKNPFFKIYINGIKPKIRNWVTKKKRLLVNSKFIVFRLALETV